MADYERIFVFAVVGQSVLSVLNQVFSLPDTNFLLAMPAVRLPSRFLIHITTVITML
jgi:hypothetical protein